MYTATIQDIRKEPHLETESEFLEVTFDVLKDGELVETRKQGFPADYTPDQITAALQDVVRDYQARDDKAAADATAAETNAAVESTMNALKGAQING